MTSHQSETIINLLDSDEHIVMLTGAGGTGKTTTISKFIESLPESASVMMCSTTHAALSVLNEMLPTVCHCHVDQATIHRFMGFTLSVDKFGKQTLYKSDKS